MMRLAVLGDPIAHSRSPEIHEAFAAQFGLIIDYQKIRPERFEDTVAALIASGARGFNCTVPFKEKAFALCDTLSTVARATGSVNTVVIEGDKLHGENTDGDGLLRDLTHNHGWSLRGCRMLMVGAGGAARGTLPALLSAAPDRLHVTNRTLSRAVDMVSGRLSDTTMLAALATDKLEDAYDVVINATSAGLEGAVPDLPGRVIGPDTRVYDMVYARGTTDFNGWAAGLGAQVCVDGLGMLVEQAALAFEHWTGQRPASGSVISQLRATLH